MCKYIDANKLKIEIERLQCEQSYKDVMEEMRYQFAIMDILDIIDSLQQDQPDVDLEKEIDEHVEGMPMSEFTHESEVDIHYDWARKEFRYFYELGLKSR